MVPVHSNALGPVGLLLLTEFTMLFKARAVQKFLNSNSAPIWVGVSKFGVGLTDINLKKKKK